MSNSSNRQYALCNKEEIAEDESKGFELTLDNKQYELFIVRKNSKFTAYVNRCPHTRITLNWQPDQFLDFDSYFIQCSTHGALFRIKDGFCVRGPCAGLSLTSIPISIDDDKLIVNLEDEHQR